MTSSYVSYKVRTRKNGDQRFHEPPGTHEYDYGPGTKDCSRGFEDKARAEYDSIILGKDGIVYKELVERRSDFRTFGKQVISRMCSGDLNHNMKLADSPDTKSAICTCCQQMQKDIAEIRLLLSKYEVSVSAQRPVDVEKYKSIFREFVAENDQPEGKP